MDVVATILTDFAARNAFGRLVARLAARGARIADAEDALSEALAAALRQWPCDGLPTNPEGWLITVARRRIADTARRGARFARSETHLALVAAELEEARMAQTELPDDRLKLMFICTHPAIDRDMQAPLMLQTVLGLTAAEIAETFLVQPNTMGVRLSRAKTRLREAGVPFDLPSAEERPMRVAALLDAIYAAFTRGSAARDSTASDRRDEALWLARLVAGLMPDDPEAQGLLSLIAHVTARHAAGRENGCYVPLGSQDTTRWNGALIAEAEAALRRASRSRTLGRYQTEAAIHSVHADRARTGVTDWDAILALYDLLLRLAPSLGAQVSRAAALVLAGRAGSARDALDQLDAGRLRSYGPYWAVRAEIQARLGEPDAAAYALQVAAGLSMDPSERAFLLGRRKNLQH